MAADEVPAGEMRPAVALEKMIGSLARSADAQERIAESLEFIAGIMEVLDNLLYNFPPDMQRITLAGFIKQYKEAVDDVEAEDENTESDKPE